LKKKKGVKGVSRKGQRGTSRRVIGTRLKRKPGADSLTLKKKTTEKGRGGKKGDLTATLIMSSWKGAPQFSLAAGQRVTRYGGTDLVKARCEGKKGVQGNI